MLDGMLILTLESEVESSGFLYIFRLGNNRFLFLCPGLATPFLKLNRLLIVAAKMAVDLAGSVVEHAVVYNYIKSTTFQARIGRNLG